MIDFSRNLACAHGWFKGPNTYPKPNRAIRWGHKYAKNLRRKLCKWFNVTYTYTMLVPSVQLAHWLWWSFSLHCAFSLTDFPCGFRFHSTHSSHKALLWGRETERDTVAVSKQMIIMSMHDIPCFVPIRTDAWNLDASRERDVGNDLW